MNIDGFTLHALIQELGDQIIGSRIDKIFQPQKQFLLLWLRCPGETKKLCITTTATHSALFLTDQKVENPAEAPLFCMVLRKHLEGGRIAALTQHHLDRLAFLHVDVRGEGGLIETKKLAIELTGKNSNVILVNSENVIIDTLRRVGPNQNRFRQILPSEIYHCPPEADKINILDHPPAALVEKLQSLPGSLLFTKACMKLFYGLGPQMAAEVAFRIQATTEQTIAQLTDESVGKLITFFRQIQELDNTKSFKPNIIDKPKQRGLFPLAMQSLDQGECILAESFSCVLDDAYFSQASNRQANFNPLQKILIHEKSRLEKKQLKLQEELAQADLAEHIKEQADILMAHLYTIPEHRSVVTLPDFYHDNQQIDLVLDPAKSPSENVQVYYQRYQKQKRAQIQLTEQLEQLKKDLFYIQSLIVSINQAETSADLAEIEKEMQQIRLIRLSSKKKTHQGPAKPLSSTLIDGSRIWIGKNNRQNDEVTFKIAKPQDLWFHVKDIPGSHVILQATEPAPEIITKVARIAAYFSQARHSSKVPVDFTKKKFVKKPSGAKPGFVIYEEQQTLFVTPNESEIKELSFNKS